MLKNINKQRKNSLRLEKEKLEAEFSILRVLAATGTLVLMFDHELRTLVDDLEEVTNTYQDIKSYIPQEKQENLAVVFNSFNDRIEMVKELGEFLGLAVGKKSRTNKQEWVRHPIVDKSVLCLLNGISKKTALNSQIKPQIL